jgi:hypothetical protein
LPQSFGLAFPFSNFPILFGDSIEKRSITVDLSKECLPFPDAERVLKVPKGLRAIAYQRLFLFLTFPPSPLTSLILFHSALVSATDHRQNPFGHGLKKKGWMIAEPHLKKYREDGR